MSRYTISLYLALFNVAAVGLLATAWAYGFVAPIFATDASHISTIIAGLMAMALVYASVAGVLLDRLDGPQTHKSIVGIEAPVDFLEEEGFMLLGIIGAIVGFILMGRAMMQTDMSSSEGMMGGLKLGISAMMTGFIPTLVGAVSKLWLKAIKSIQGYRIRAIEILP